ncbi:hypothetical protein AB0K47_06855 [Streptomyces tirandamycinicus]|uniref:hypothetical protein n=1 Tax=Streptomyces tirandamycinicus TaxID=2174846 RepID=UPI00342ADA92
MDVFTCVGCGAVLTAPVSQVALPVHAHHLSWHELLPPLMEPGTYAVDPEPSGPPWRPWDEVGAVEAAARGVNAPVYSLSFGASGRIVVAPGDSRGTVLIPEQCEGYCLGLDGRNGPNLACECCGLAVATRMDDCSIWQAVWLEPGAVRRVPAGVPAPPADWESLAREPCGTPPIEPVGAWSPRWEAAVAAALAHLVVACDGGPVTLPDGLVAEVFGHGVAALLPPGPSVKSVGLAGPGLAAAGPAPDIALVPRHLRTGEPWRRSGAGATVPLATEVWTYLAFPRETSPLPASGTLPDGVLRDDYPLPPHPMYTFRPDKRVFLDTLARLDAVRQPWLRDLYDQVRKEGVTFLG